MRLGAAFADARVELHHREVLVLADGVLTQATVRLERGLGVRTLVNGAWGFAAVSNPTRHDAAVLARRAIELGRAAAVVQERAIQLVDEPPQTGTFRTAIERDPLAVGIDEKLALLFAIHDAAGLDGEVAGLEAELVAQRTRRLYVSSEGAELDQDLTDTDVRFVVSAGEGLDRARRTFVGVGRRPVVASRGHELRGPRPTASPAPGSRDEARGAAREPRPTVQPAPGRGFELVAAVDWADHARRLADEARALSRAPSCPAGEVAAVLAPTPLALLLHETLARPLELDRVLGGERADEGGSFVVVGALGAYPIGSRHLHVVSDPRVVGGVGGFGFDDEGVPAQRVELVREGRLVGFLAGREAAERVGLDRATGTLRAASFAHLPLVRATHLALEPGSGGDLDALLADTADGVLFDGPGVVTVDDRGLHAELSAELGWELKRGKRTRLVRAPRLAGRTPALWSALDAIAGAASAEHVALGPRSKGDPAQPLAVGHAVAPARIARVLVGSRPSERAALARASAGLLDHPSLDAGLARTVGTTRGPRPTDPAPPRRPAATASSKLAPPVTAEPVGAPPRDPAASKRRARAESEGGVSVSRAEASRGASAPRGDAAPRRGERADGGGTRPGRAGKKPKRKR